MGTEVTIQETGTVKLTPTEVANGGGVAPIYFPDGAKGVNQVLPPFTEIMRRGQGYTVRTATLFAPLVAVPTTTAALEVYNNAQGEILVVTDLFMEQILATAAQQANYISAMVTTKKAIPTLTALALTSMSGKPAVTPTAASDIVTGVGTTVVANGWRVYGPGLNWGLGTATPGPGYSAPIDGKIIVPYGCSLCVHVVGALATASSVHVGATFARVAVDVED